MKYKNKNYMKVKHDEYFEKPFFYKDEDYAYGFDTSSLLFKEWEIFEYKISNGFDTVEGWNEYGKSKGFEYSEPTIKEIKLYELYKKLNEV